ncbi:MAG: hypothetical protein HY282_15985 [Nitrospirae bacterium]|nr:hypothetical protein [Candidatus Manganitrophaceae bacterium]
MSDYAATFPSESPGWERRNRSFRNRLRRKLNDYWLIPLLLCYLQLSTQFIYSAEPPLERLYKGNKNFLQGIPVFYKITTQAFPYTLIGHFSEIADYGLYQLNLLQVPHDELRSALEAPKTGQQIYDRVAASRQYRQSELGGILTLSYREGRPEVHLYEIPSLNSAYLAQLREMRQSILRFADFISLSSNQDIFEKVGLQQRWVTDLTRLLRNDRLADKVKMTLVDNFIETFEALSESRFLLSPYQFKEALGKVPFGEHFVALFHFHNGVNEPPSSIDIEQSLRKRQVVMTLSRQGLVLYDVVKQDLQRIDIDIDKRVSLQ